MPDRALNDATFYQAAASNRWNYYQAKSIKQNLFEIGRSDDAARIARYDQEKNQIKEEATKLATAQMLHAFFAPA